MRNKDAAAKPTACKGCGESIFFAAHLVTGELAPLNVEPDDNGMIMLVPKRHARQAYPQYRFFEPLFDARPEALYTSHYATCPKAASFRKKEQGR